jgi:hypothetical protein
MIHFKDLSELLLSIPRRLTHSDYPGYLWKLLLSIGFLCSRTRYRRISHNVREFHFMKSTQGIASRVTGVQV